MIAVAVLVVPMIALAASGPITKNEISVGRIMPAAAGDNPTARRVTVPVSLENKDMLVAMDIPLSFGRPGDGITLVDVTYASRIAGFNEKITNIDNQKKTVDMGLISMAYDPNTPDLAAGQGEIANLTFEITDPTMTHFTLAATQMNNPSHRLMMVYHEYVNGRPEVRWDGQDFSVDVAVPASLGGVVPKEYALDQNYPNPFNAGTVIRFAMPEYGNARVTVYNVLGQTVRTLADRDFDAGYQSVTWDGSEESGVSASSGVYFYRIVTKGFTDTKKMTLLK